MVADMQMDMAADMEVDEVSDIHSVSFSETPQIVAMTSIITKALRRSLPRRSPPLARSRQHHLRGRHQVLGIFTCSLFIQFLLFCICLSEGVSYIYCSLQFCHTGCKKCSQACRSHEINCQTQCNKSQKTTLKDFCNLLTEQCSVKCDSSFKSVFFAFFRLETFPWSLFDVLK